MHEKLHDHIIFLEERIQTISDRVTDPRLTAPAREMCEAELRVAELTMALCRAAYDLERCVAQPTS